MKKILFASILSFALILTMPISNSQAGGGHSDGKRKGNHKTYGERMAEQHPEKAERKRAREEERLEKKRERTKEKNKENARKAKKIMRDMKKSIDRGDVNLTGKEMEIMENYKNMYQ